MAAYGSVREFVELEIEGQERVPASKGVGRWKVALGMGALLGFAGTAAAIGVAARADRAPQALKAASAARGEGRWLPGHPKAPEETAEEEREAEEEQEIEADKEKALQEQYGLASPNATSATNSSAPARDPADPAADPAADPLVAEQWRADHWWAPELDAGVSRWLRSTGVTEDGTKTPVASKDEHWDWATVCDTFRSEWGTPVANARWACPTTLPAPGAPAEFRTRFHVEDDEIRYRLDYLVDGEATVLLNGAPLAECGKGRAGAMTACGFGAENGLVLGNNILKVSVLNTAGQTPALAVYASVEKPNDTVFGTDHLFVGTGFGADGALIARGALDAHWYDLTNGKPLRAAPEEFPLGPALEPFPNSKFVVPDDRWDKDPAVLGRESTYVIATNFAVPEEESNKRMELLMRGGNDVLAVFCDRHLVRPCTVGGSAQRKCAFDLDQTCQNALVDGFHELMVVYHTQPDDCGDDQEHCHSAISVSAHVIEKHHGK